MTKAERREAFNQAIQDAIGDAIDDKVNIPWILGMLEYYKATVAQSMMDAVKEHKMSEEETSQSLSE